MSPERKPPHVAVKRILRQVGDMVENLLETEGLEPSDLRGIGIAAPGQVDRKTGQLRFGLRKRPL